MVAHFDLESFVHPFVIGIDSETGAAALAHQIEAVAGVDPHGLVAGRVIDGVFTGEFELAIIVAAIKTQPALGQCHPKIIGFGILEFLHDPNFWIGLGAVAGVFDKLVRRVVAITVHGGAVVNVNALRFHARGRHEFHLFGLAVA